LAEGGVVGLQRAAIAVGEMMRKRFAGHSSRAYGRAGGQATMMPEPRPPAAGVPRRAAIVRTLRP